MTGYPKGKSGLKAAVSILAAADDFDGISVATKLPLTALPAKFVRVDLAGGSRPLIVTHVTRILVELWAATVQPDGSSGVDAVFQMSEDAIAALQNAQGTIVDGAFIRGFDNISGTVNLPEPDVDQWERWQFQGDLLVSTSDTEVVPGS